MPTRPNIARVYVRTGGLLGVLSVAVAALLSSSAPAASTSSTVVGATVPSATQLDLSGCSGVAAATQLGAVPAGSTSVTSAPCSVDFGSSNDSSQLRVRQWDATGDAMGALPDGTLDTGFGDGIPTYDIPGSGTGDLVYAATVDTQGRIVLVGETWGGGNYMALARLLPDGTPDPTFDGGVGGNGLVANTICNCELQDVAIDSQGRIVAVARSNSGIFGATTNRDPVVFRFLDDGTLDTSFNGTGYQRIVIAGANDLLLTLHLTRYDEIVAAGRVGNDSLVIRVREDGTLDPNFGSGGQVQVNFAAGQVDRIVDIAELPDGNLVGLVELAADNQHLGVFKFDPATGAVDAGWGGGLLDLGFASDNNGKVFGYGSLAVDPAGRTWIGTNYETGAETDYAIARITAAGALDGSWGPGGMRSYDVDGDEGQHGVGIMLHADGSIALASMDLAATHTVLLRVLASGAPDSAFGSGGVRVISEEPVQTVGRIYPITGGGYLVPVAYGSEVGALKLESPTVPDWSGTWTGSTFGACLEQTDAATTSWTEAGVGACTTAGTAMWNAVPATSSNVASTSGAGTATADFRFGMRSDTGLATGRYEARLLFEVVAPAS